MKITIREPNITGIQYIILKKLFGMHDVNISFDNKINIYIGENGLGKTTILNCIYYILTKRFDKLSDINFSGFIIKFVSEQDPHVITINDINKYIKKDPPRISFRYNHFFRRVLWDLEEKIYNNMGEIDYEIEKAALRISFEYDIPVSVVRRELERYFRNNESIKSSNIQLGNAQKIEKLIKAIDTFVKYSIIYLPTYRRIENDFSNLIDSRNYKPDSNQLIRFGMADVENSINKKLTIIKNEAIDSFNRMTGVLLKQYSSYVGRNKNLMESSIDIETVKIIFNRIGEVGKEDKQKILALIEDGSINDDKYYYLRNLLHNLINRYDVQRKHDDKLNNFVETCNNYLKNKKMIYDQNNLSLKVVMETYDNTKKEIQLTDLSSGEKQIVSLFSQLYLDIETPCILIIDEPELSLSIYWQKRLLPDIFKSGNCRLLITATHSPFIFDNEYDKYVRDMREFLSPSKMRRVKNEQ